MARTALSRPALNLTALGLTAVAALTRSTDRLAAEAWPAGGRSTRRIPGTEALTGATRRRSAECRSRLSWRLLRPLCALAAVRARSLLSATLLSGSTLLSVGTTHACLPRF